MDGTIGRRFGQTTITAPIGEGSMGAVYRGRHDTLGSDVAVKILAPGFTAEFVRRFVRECRLASRVRHPNVVQVIESAVLGDNMYLIMELVEGEDLGKRIRALKRLPLTDALTYAAHIASGLAAIHAQGIIHRDLKPDNILIDPKGAARIADLGLSKCVADTDIEHLTQTGFVVGTPHYVAPECLRDPKSASGASDVYGYGATIYHAFAGAPPFDGSSAIDVLRAHLTQLPKPIRSNRPDVVPEVARLIDACLQKDPLLRPTAAAIANVLLRRIGGGRLPNSAPGPIA